MSMQSSWTSDPPGAKSRVTVTVALAKALLAISALAELST